MVFSNRRLRNSRSSSGAIAGSPKGFGTAFPRTILFTPIVWANGDIAVTSTVGNPARSNSFAIVAPLRVQVPQVAPTITASISAMLKSLAISAPMRRMSVSEPLFPVVV